MNNIRLTYLPSGKLRISSLGQDIVLTIAQRQLIERYCVGSIPTEDQCTDFFVSESGKTTEVP